jgi:lysophospholipase
MTAMPNSRRAYPEHAMLSTIHTADGWPLRVFDLKASASPRGSILWLGGRGDIFEKYLESFVEWHAAGWQVTSFDWRGQGGSGRLLADAMTGHARDFETWVTDLSDFWTDWVVRTPAPHVLMGHSMGGHLVVRALAERRVAPDAVVLSAPMLGFETGPLLRPVAGAVASVLGRLIPERLAWPSNEKPGAVNRKRQEFLSNDPDRYADELWWKTEKPELNMGPASWGWVAAAYRSIAGLDKPGAIESIATPVLVIGTDGDELVSPQAIRHYAARIPGAELLMFDKSVAHEVLREVDMARDVALARIAAFLDKAAPAP